VQQSLVGWRGAFLGAAVAAWWPRPVLAHAPAAPIVARRASRRTPDAHRWLRLVTRACDPDQTSCLYLSRSAAVGSKTIWAALGALYGTPAAVGNSRPEGASHHERGPDVLVGGSSPRPPPMKPLAERHRGSGGLVGPRSCAAIGPHRLQCAGARGVCRRRSLLRPPYAARGHDSAGGVNRQALLAGCCFRSSGLQT